MAKLELSFAPGTSLSVDAGKVGLAPSVGLIVKHGGAQVAVHMTAAEARAHAKAVSDQADLLEAATPKAAVAAQVPAPDRSVK